MIVYDKEQKQIVIPNGLGNVNIVINQGGGECPECPELTEIAITENGRYEGAYNVVNVDVPTEGSSCNLGEGDFVFGINDVGRYELNASDDGYDGWSKIYLEIEGEGAIKVHRAADLLNDFNTNIDVLEFGRNYYVGGKITEIQQINTQYGNATYILDNGFQVFRGKWIDGNGFSSEDQIKVGAYIVVYGVLKNYNEQLELDKDSQVIAYQECAGGDCPEGGCKLITRTFKENGTYRASDGYNIPVINLSQNGAFDSKLKVETINTYIEFYFAFKDERPDLMSFYGCEDGDWNDSTFAARYYQGNINVKIGAFERSFNVDEYGLTDGNAHKMKVGRTYGIEIDGQMVTTSSEIENGIVFTPSETRTIYIGAINSPDIEDNGLNLFRRPFNGYIGNVAIYGKREDGEQVLYNYEAGDYGWWGDYKIVETDQRVENINRESGATPLEYKTYNPNADGFSEVTVNLRMETRDIRMDSKRRTEAAGWYGLAGFSEVNIDATDLYNTASDEGKRFIINSLEELNVSENGTYEAPGIYDEFKETHKYVENTGSFVTDFTPQLNDTAVNDGGFEIEVQAKVNSSEGGEKFIVGCAAERHWENAGIDTNINNVVLKAKVDATCLYMSGIKTYNMPTINDEWVTYRITENGLDYKRELQQEWSHLDWEGDVKPRDVWNNKGNDSPIAIGGLNTFYDGLFNEFQGSIRYVRFKQGDYDKVWYPDGGQMKAEGTDDFLDIQDGEAPDFVMDAFKTGSQGWKKVNVNVEFNKVEMSFDEYLSMTEYDNNTIYLLN